MLSLGASIWGPCLTAYIEFFFFALHRILNFIERLCLFVKLLLMQSISFRFEATRRIREMEHSINRGEVSVRASESTSNWHVPILAMTADVIQATHEECLRCGMDGYVSKPFEAEQLYLEVSRFFQ